MFKRRAKLSLWSVARNFLWPRIGWNRSTKYVIHRVSRLRGTPYALAAGFACGAAISFTPFVGLHFLLSAALAWLIRANIIASAIGTVVGNPWTFPFIWVWIYKLGTWMWAMEHVYPVEKLDFAASFGHLVQGLINMDVRYLAETAWPIFGPMLFGSIPTAIAVWIAFYFALKPAILSYQVQRRARRMKKAREAAADSASIPGPQNKVTT